MVVGIFQVAARHREGEPLVESRGNQRLQIPLHVGFDTVGAQTYVIVNTRINGTM